MTGLEVICVGLVVLVGLLVAALIVQELTMRAAIAELRARRLRSLSTREQLRQMSPAELRALLEIEKPR